MLEKKVRWAGVVFELHIGMIIHHLGGMLSITKGQYHTIKCVTQTHRWTCILRILLAMLYSENYLKGRCAIGKKNNLNSSMDKEEMGAIKGTTKNVNFSY